MSVLLVANYGAVIVFCTQLASLKRLVLCRVRSEIIKGAINLAGIVTLLRSMSARVSGSEKFLLNPVEHVEYARA